MSFELGKCKIYGKTFPVRLGYEYHCDHYVWDLEYAVENFDCGHWTYENEVYRKLLLDHLNKLMDEIANACPNHNVAAEMYAHIYDSLSVGDIQHDLVTLCHGGKTLKIKSNYESKIMYDIENMYRTIDLLVKNRYSETAHNLEIEAIRKFESDVRNCLVDTDVAWSDFFDVVFTGAFLSAKEVGDYDD